jgi:predicted anti-sigma-YlaC factor YlaD
MDCEEARSLLVDAADGEVAEGGDSPLGLHLAECSQCQGELEPLRQAALAVRAAVDELAPQEVYLTSERLGRLMIAYGRDTKVIKLRFHRGLVAATAVAAILVSATVIALSLPSMFTPPDAPGLIASQPVLPSAIPVVLTATGQGEPVRMIRAVTSNTLTPSTSGRLDRGVQFVRTNGSGVSVPVEHALYDPEESSRWW